MLTASTDGIENDGIENDGIEIPTNRSISVYRYNGAYGKIFPI